MRRSSTQRGLLRPCWESPSATGRFADSVCRLADIAWRADGSSTTGATLLDYLRSYRLTLELKCSGLTAEQLATRSVPPSQLSLLGLVRHLAQVEQSWFRRVMAGDDETGR